MIGEDKCDYTLPPVQDTGCARPRSFFTVRDTDCVRHLDLNSNEVFNENYELVGTYELEEFEDGTNVTITEEVNE